VTAVGADTAVCQWPIITVAAHAARAPAVSAELTASIQGGSLRCG